MLIVAIDFTPAVSDNILVNYVLGKFYSSYQGYIIATVWGVNVTLIFKFLLLILVLI